MSPPGRMKPPGRERERVLLGGHVCEVGICSHCQRMHKRQPAFPLGRYVQLHNTPTSSIVALYPNQSKPFMVDIKSLGSLSVSTVNKRSYLEEHSATSRSSADGRNPWPVDICWHGTLSPVEWNDPSWRGSSIGFISCSSGYKMRSVSK